MGGGSAAHLARWHRIGPRRPGHRAARARVRRAASSTWPTSSTPQALRAAWPTTSSSCSGRLMTVDSLKFTSDPELFPSSRPRSRPPSTSRRRRRAPPPAPRRRAPPRRPAQPTPAAPAAPTPTRPDRHRDPLRTTNEDLPSRLWHDLRAKRLWPVAAVLLLALVAVPVVLSKPAEDRRGAEPPRPRRDGPSRKDSRSSPSVKLEREPSRGGSALDAFDPSDPFRPPQGDRKRRAEADGPPASGARTRPSAQAAPAADRRRRGRRRLRRRRHRRRRRRHRRRLDRRRRPPTRPQFTYVVDVTFAAQRPQAHDQGHASGSTCCPARPSPLLLFLGVDAERRQRGLPRGLDPDGRRRGHVQARAADCAFLYLGAGLRARVHERGRATRYTLRIDEIRKVQRRRERRGRRAARRPRPRGVGAAAGRAASPRR